MRHDKLGRRPHVPPRSAPHAKNRWSQLSARPRQSTSESTPVAPKPAANDPAARHFQTNPGAALLVSGATRDRDSLALAASAGATLPAASASTAWCLRDRAGSHRVFRSGPVGASARGYPADLLGRRTSAPSCSRSCVDSAGQAQLIHRRSAAREHVPAPCPRHLRLKKASRRDL